MGSGTRLWWSLVHVLSLRWPGLSALSLGSLPGPRVSLPQDRLPVPARGVLSQDQPWPAGPCPGGGWVCADNPIPAGSSGATQRGSLVTEPRVLAILSASRSERRPEGSARRRLSCLPPRPGPMGHRLEQALVH